MPAGDAHRSRLQRAGAARRGRPRAPEEREARPGSPTLEPNVKTVEAVEFKGPFPEKARFTVELPRDFRDDAGREPENKSAFPLATGTDEYPAARQVSRDASASWS